MSPGGFWESLGLRALLLLACSVSGLVLMEQHRDAEEDQEVNKAILEMLHINQVSASRPAKVHPYMRRIHQRLNSLEAPDFERPEGILMQSFHSSDGKHFHFDLSKRVPLSFSLCLCNYTPLF